MHLKKLNKHDRYVLALCDRLYGIYDKVYTNILFKNSKRVIAEIDIYSTKDNTIDIYEVKCSNRIIKAKKQLGKIKKILLENQSKEYKTNNCEYRFFFYCGSSNELIKLS